MIIVRHMLAVQYSKVDNDLQGSWCQKELNRIVEPYDSMLGANETDRVPCIACPSWPDEAGEWVARRHPLNEWPSETIRREIVAAGCHIVAVEHRTSSFPEVEWRFSFSKAELRLARCLTAANKQAYLLLKLVYNGFLKLYLAASSGLISSYHLKTALFWTLEEHGTDQKQTTADTWGRRGLYPALIALLGKVYDFLKDGNFPNYFIPENNMIDHLPREAVEALAAAVDLIRRDVFNALLVRFDRQLRFHFAPVSLRLEELLRPCLDALAATGNERSGDDRRIDFWAAYAKASSTHVACLLLEDKNFEALTVCENLLSAITHRTDEDDDEVPLKQDDRTSTSRRDQLTLYVTSRLRMQASSAKAFWCMLLAAADSRADENTRLTGVYALLRLGDIGRPSCFLNADGVLLLRFAGNVDDEDDDEKYVNDEGPTAPIAGYAVKRSRRRDPTLETCQLTSSSSATPSTAVVKASKGDFKRKVEIINDLVEVGEYRAAEAELANIVRREYDVVISVASAFDAAAQVARAGLSDYWNLQKRTMVACLPYAMYLQFVCNLRQKTGGENVGGAGATAMRVLWDLEALCANVVDPMATNLAPSSHALLGLCYSQVGDHLRALGHFITSVELGLTYDYGRFGLPEFVVDVLENKSPNQSLH